MTTLLAFLFVLGVLVFVHELGHFLVARWHGVRVITFSLGFGPKILKVTRGDTEYCISIVPLGGYVKLAGETVEDNQTGAPDEFLSKSKWVRFQVYIAGPVMNILLAIIVTAAVLTQGADVPVYRSSPPVIGSVAPGSQAEAAGLRRGDRIVSVDGRDVPTWDALDMEVVLKAAREVSIVIERDGQPVTIRVTPDSVGSYEIGELGIEPAMRPQVKFVNPGSPAEAGGFQPHDVVVAVNGERGLGYDAVLERIRGNPDAPLPFVVERAGAPIELSVVPRGPKGAALIGVGLTDREYRRIDPGVAQAIRMSVQQNWESALMIGRTLGGLLTRETPVRQLVGPIGIAELSGNMAGLGWIPLFSFMAMISLNLGLLNLMPVPVLDGGHIAILAVEGLARRDLSVRVKERILITGAALMVLLMVTVIYNDIARLLR
jgi:regulator of sigma E protease